VSDIPVVSPCSLSKHFSLSFSFSRLLDERKIENKMLRVYLIFVLVITLLGSDSLADPTDGPEPDETRELCIFSKSGKASKGSGRERKLCYRERERDLRGNGLADPNNGPISDEHREPGANSGKMSKTTP
jgi:hypothetical protein